MLYSRDTAYRLRAVIYAVTLLEATADLLVILSPGQQGGLLVEYKSKELPTLSTLIKDGLSQLVKSNVDLKAYLRKVKNADNVSQMPRWIEVLKTLEGSEVPIKVLDALIKDWPENWQENDNIRGSWNQANILRTQLYQSAMDWNKAIEVADKTVEGVLNFSQEYLARANRASCLGDALVAQNFNPTKELAKVCYKDFEIILASRKPFSGYGPVQLLEKILKKFKRFCLPGRSQREDDSVCKLYRMLSQLNTKVNHDLQRYNDQEIQSGRKEVSSEHRPKLPLVEALPASKHQVSVGQLNEPLQTGHCSEQAE